MRVWLGAVAVAFASMAGAEEMRPVPVAWFTDNVDRQPLQALREKPEAELTEAERAILVAANRVGWIEILGCNRASHGILIRLDGRDAVVTSRHLVAGKWAADLKCPADATAVFYPNYGYRIPGSRERISDYDIYAPVLLEPDPLNYGPRGLFMEPDEDWLIYFLSEDVSDQPLPEGAFGAGTPRGAMEFSTRYPLQGDLVVIGMDGRYTRENGWQFTWAPCRFARGGITLQNTLMIDCDVSPGASSSLLTTMEEGRLTFQGLVTAASDRLAGNDVPVPGAALLWNIGTPTDQITGWLEDHPRGGP